MESIREFLQSSTIHGLVYIATTNHLTRLFWLTTVLVGFSVAAVMIQQNFANWQANPVATTLESHPLSQLSFPKVTVCPPIDTFTTLNLDIEMIENMTLQNQQNTKDTLKKHIPLAIFDSDFEENFSFFTKVTNVTEGWYLGDNSINFLFPPKHPKQWSLVEYRSSEISGVASSPDFEKPFDEDTFKIQITFRITIDVPKNLTRNASINIEFKFDTERPRYKNWLENVVIGSSENESSPYFWVNEKQDEELEEFTHSTRKCFQKGPPLKINECNIFYFSCPCNYVLCTFSLLLFYLLASERPFLRPSQSYSKKFPIETQSYFFIKYSRWMTAENFFQWKSKRNTGLRLSWSYDATIEREYKYRDDNKPFIKLANLLHARQNKSEIWNEIKKKRFQYLTNIIEEEVCVGENLNRKKSLQLIQKFFSSFPWVSNKPIFENQISPKTLAETQRMFYYLTRCPNYYDTALDLRNFFWRLINLFPLKTILLTIVRMVETTMKNKKKDEMMAANELLKKIDKIVALSIYNQKNDTKSFNSVNGKR